MFLFVCCNPSEAVTFGGGTGDQNDPYIIETPAHLQELATETNGGDNFSGKYFILSQDIDLSIFPNWTAIGKAGATRFDGIFDGDNHTISNLTIEVTTTGNFGLFGVSDANSIIRNVRLENMAITLNYTGGSSGYTMIFLGGLTSAILGTVENCTVNGFIRGNSNAYDTVVGGLINSNVEGIIKNCTSNVDIYIAVGASSRSDGYCDVGGLVMSNQGTMENCSATGSNNHRKRGNNCWRSRGCFGGYRHTAHHKEQFGERQHQRHSQSYLR